MARSVSSAGRHPSSSTDADAAHASLQELTQLRERHRAAETAEARALERREAANKDVKRLIGELNELGYDGTIDFDIWLAARMTELDEELAEIESMLEGAK